MNRFAFPFEDHNIFISPFLSHFFIFYFASRVPFHSVRMTCCYIQVAARVTGDNAEKDEWFVVKVIHFDRETKE